MKKCKFNKRGCEEICPGLKALLMAVSFMGLKAHAPSADFISRGSATPVGG
jgi:hypothetical protein